MRTYAIKRLLIGMVTLVLVATLVFLLMRAIPGDAIDVYLADPQVGAGMADPGKLRAALGLDKPVPQQYREWMSGLIRGNLGVSLWSGRPLIEEIAPRLPVTIQLALMTILLSSAIAIALGVLASVYPDTPVDYLARGMAVLGLAMPTVWLATMVVVLPAVYFGWVPPVYYVPIWVDPIPNLKQFIAPTLVASVFGSAGTMRMTRAMMLAVLRQDYISLARAKGLKDFTVYVRHALKNAMIPVLTIIGLRIVAALDGTVILESIFGLPGIGSYTVQAALNRDYTAMQALILWFAGMTILLNLVVDLMYGWLDPRVKYK